MPEGGMPNPVSRPDLLQVAQSRTRRAALVAAGALALSAAWALWPLHTPTVPMLADAPPPPTTDAPSAPLDLALFDAPVWTIAQPVAEAAAPPPPPPPPPPLKVQLIGIIKEEVGYKAVLYDPDSNKLRVVEVGEEVQGRRIASVTADSVKIGEGLALQTLLLKTTLPGQAGGGP